MKVCIDAGHGLPDPGAVGPTGLRESDVTLLFAMFMATSLEEEGHQAVLTRENFDALHKNKSTDLAARAMKANTAKCDCFVSIHCNGAIDQSANGSESWYHPSSTEGQRLAKLIQTALVSSGGLRNRGIKQSAGLAVLRLTAMPAVLIELAFISNPEEEKRLSNPEWLSSVARELANAIGKWEKVISSTP